MPFTCIFKGDELLDNNKVEHLIPKGLCGRIKSNQITCTEINEKAGNWCDLDLCQLYQDIRCDLNDLLPSEFKDFTLIGQGSLTGERIKIEGGNRIKPDGLKKIGNSWYGPPELMKKLVASGKFKYEGLVNITDLIGTHSERKIMLFSPAMITGAIKIIMCMLDYMEKDKSEPSRISRSTPLKHIRDTALRAILTCDENIYIWDNIFCGMQYNSLIFQNSMSALGVEFPNDDFAHSVIISGDHGSHVIHGVFIAFGYEPWGFCLSNSWEGSDFTYLYSQSILKANNPIFRSYSTFFPLCENNFSLPVLLSPITEEGFALFEKMGDALKNKLLDVISNHKDHARARSLLLVETTADITEHIIEIAKLEFEHSSELSLYDILIIRLKLIFPNFKNRIEEIVNMNVSISEYLNGQLFRSIDALCNYGTNGWQKFHDHYRFYVHAIHTLCGLPGHFYSHSREIKDARG